MKRRASEAQQSAADLLKEVERAGVLEVDRRGRLQYRLPDGRAVRVHLNILGHFRAVTVQTDTTLETYFA